jgi:hypothetical protein
VDKPAKPCGSTLTQGSDGFWEMQAREKAAEQEGAESGNGQAASPPSSVQGARELRQWELEQGIDPSYGSGHERRPPSSSKDAAELEHKRKLESDVEWQRWFYQTRKRHNTKKKKALEKWRGFNDAVAGEMFVQIIKDGLMHSRSPVSKGMGRTVPGLGLLFEYLNPPELDD